MPPAILEMLKPEFSEFLEFLHAIAVSRGVTVYPDVDQATGEIRQLEHA